MHIDQDMLETLISRRLDQEITPIEDQLLQEKLDADPAAMTLFERLSSIDSTARIGLERRLKLGRPAHVIVQSALQRRPAHEARKKVHTLFFSRFTTGLAAGLLIAMAIQMALSKPDIKPPDAFATKAREPFPAQTTQPVSRPYGAGGVRRNVDWYQFTDEQGNHWVVEGLREDKVRPAVYEGDL